MADHLNMRELLEGIKGVASSEKTDLKEGKKKDLMESAGYRRKEDDSYIRKDFFIPEGDENIRRLHNEVARQSRDLTRSALEQKLGKGKFRLEENRKDGENRRLTYIYEGKRGKAAIGYDLILHSDDGEDLIEVSQGVVIQKK